MRAPVASKATYETEPPGPFRWARSLLLLSPFHRQRNGNVCRTALFEKRGELYQAHLGLQQLESQTAAHFDVVLHRLTPRVHCAPPGQGKAKVRWRAMRDPLSRR